MPTPLIDGGLSLGGSASVRLILPYEASGSLLIGGAADVASTNWNYTASGTLSLGGSAPVASSSWNYTGSGNLELKDSAPFTGSITPPPSEGGGGISGSADVTIIFYYTASGGLGVGDSAPVSIQPKLSTTFTWDVSQGVLRTWRVEGRCVPSNLPNPPTVNLDPGCPPNSSTMQMVVNVQAHSTTDLCNKLKERGLTGPIKKIQVWGLPVNKSDWKPSDRVDYNTLSTVDFTKIPECIDFTVDQNLSVSAKASASLIFTSSYSYECSGGLGSGGTTSNPVSSYFAYTASGGLGLGESAPVSSPQYFVYVASGGLGTGGAAEAYSSDYGTVSASGKASMSVMNLGITFGSEAAGTLTASDVEVDATCCGSLKLPQILFVRHELMRSDNLFNFLKVNGLTLPPIVNLMYNQHRNSWYYNKQFSGISVNNEGNEIWNILFEFGCLTENALLGIPSNVWGFSIVVKRKLLSNSRIDITRLLLEFDPLEVCDVSGSLNFDFTFNRQLLTTNPAVIRTVVFTDEVGSFIGSTYLTNPTTSFEVNASTPNLGVGLFDQSVPFQNMLLSGV